MNIVIFVSIILYIISIIGCIIYCMEMGINLNIISIFIVICPIINTIYAFKCPDIKETIKQLIGKKKEEI